MRRLEQDADLLVADVRRALQNPYDTRVPPLELTDRLEAMLAEAESRQRLYGQSLATLRYVVEQAVVDGQKSEVTLREAIERSRVKRLTRPLGSSQSPR